MCGNCDHYYWAQSVVLAFSGPSDLKPEVRSSYRDGWEDSYRQPIALPLTTHSSCQVWAPSASSSPSSSFQTFPHPRLLPPFIFSSWGFPVIIKSPPPLVANTTALSMSNPFETARGSQYRGNWFSPLNMEHLVWKSPSNSSNHHKVQKIVGENRKRIGLHFPRKGILV